MKWIIKRRMGSGFTKRSWVYLTVRSTWGSRGNTTDLMQFSKESEALKKALNLRKESVYEYKIDTV